MEFTIKVTGMICPHCQAHVEKALAAVEGVASAAADLQGKCATVTLSAEVSDQQLMDVVKEAGYTPLGCRAE